MKAIDLFCGCGGLTQGLRQAGFRVVGAVEIDPLAAETYTMNHKSTRLWKGDIRALNTTDIMSGLGLAQGELDLLAGCPPCQGFSSMRTRNGSREIDDPINDLVFEFLRFVRAFRPKAIMLENVPGLYSDPRFFSIVRSLRGLGYRLDIRVIDVAGYAVPQRRKRLILIGGLKKKIPIAAPSPRITTVRMTIAKLPAPGISGDPLHDFPENRNPRIISLIKCVPRDGGSRRDLPQSMQLSCHRKCDGYKDVYGRMRWDAVSPTITGGCVNPSKGRFLHPDQNRCISLREAALLQGFPLKYKFSLSRGKFPTAQMIGNALPPPFIRIQAKAIIQALMS
ncbi:MAG TPA: DNA cytosine methyltransferase [Candidatus Cloacimonadota bacterium]|nr:DNA cytosine methyltransferase [Candidatus Cloacimonadota bacterium]